MQRFLSSIIGISIIPGNMLLIIADFFLFNYREFTGKIIGNYRDNPAFSQYNFFLIKAAIIGDLSKISFVLFFLWTVTNYIGMLEHKKIVHGFGTSHSIFFGDVKCLVVSYSLPWNGNLIRKGHLRFPFQFERSKDMSALFPLCHKFIYYK